MMSSPDDLKSRFNRFREKKYALPLALLLTFIVCSVLLMYSAKLCFGYLLVAVVAYYLPYYFGLKDRRKLAVFGAVLMVAIAIPFGLMIASDYQGFEGSTVSTDDRSMFDGGVTPFSDVDGRTHNYTVTVSDPAITNVSVAINDWWTNTNINSPNFNYTMTQYVDVEGGRQFYLEVQLPEQSMYAFHFSALNGTEWIRTDVTVGPIDMPSGDFYTKIITGTILSTFMTVGILFYLLLVLTWFADRSRKKAIEMQKNMNFPPAGDQKSKEKFICSECRAEVPADAKTCPQCGERFDDEPEAPAAAAKEDEYYCTDCGATVQESDTVCPNCGKKFED
jgi:RNA polymerase subunit RPABC4/transcription elongation factor Spt4